MGVDQRHEGAAGAAMPAIHAYAALPTGIHAITREQAVEFVRPTKSPAAAAERPLVWIDVQHPGEAEAAFLREQLGFHPLAVEDCMRGRQRPKLERYPAHLFLVFYAAVKNPERDRVALNELHLFLGENFIVSVQDVRIRHISGLVARWRSSPRHFPGIGSLAHALLDTLVDEYFTVMEHFAERTDELENAVFDQARAEYTQRILKLRHELVLFRRIVAPQRDVLSTMLRRDIPFLQPELVPYFQDVFDHLLRVTEEIDAQRELLSALLEAQYAAASSQLNSTMRMLTAWSIILMSMALISGIYGMNFSWMPELEWQWGYFGALGVMSAIGAGLVLFFRRRGYL